MTTTTTARPFTNRDAETGAIIVTGYALTWAPAPTFTRNGTPIFQTFTRESLTEQLEWLWTIRNYSSVEALFNHGQDVDGNPTPVFADPIGTVTSLVPDDTGLLARIAFGRSVLAETTLRMIGSREVAAMSTRLKVYDADPEASARPYDVLNVHRARMTELGPSTNPHDAGARILTVEGGGITCEIRERSSWVSDLDKLLTQAEAAEERGRALTREIDTTVSWERRTRNQPIWRRDPAPRLTVSAGMTSGQRWAARGDAERDAERLHKQARALMAEHGYSR
jgi:hypothetical protein